MFQRGAAILAEASGTNIIGTSSHHADSFKLLAFWHSIHFSIIFTYSKNINVKAEKE